MSMTARRPVMLEEINLTLSQKTGDVRGISFSLMPEDR